MSHMGPFFYGWCPDNERVSAYAAALSALLTPKWWSDPQTREQLVEKARAEFAAATCWDDDRSYQLLSGHVVYFDLAVWRDSYEYAHGAPLVLQPEHHFDMLFLKMPMARIGMRSVEIESAIFSIVTFEDTIDLLRRLCAPDETSRVTTGACSWNVWESPLDACITYNADANVARDLALAWLNGYDETPAVQMAGLDLRQLQARIATATTTRAPVAQGSSIELLDTLLASELPYYFPPLSAMEYPQSPRHELTREQVLAVLETPHAKLLEALETAAAPDAEWRAVEPLALENIEAKKRGVECDDVCVTSRRHLRFLEQHAPYHVRRLPNGGVMLATHPYRTLWPLWARALDLLGIRPATK